MKINPEVKGVTKKDLYQEHLYEDDKGKPLAFIPASKRKWLLQNGRIAEDDYVAVITTIGKELVSFIYLIPDLFRTREGLQKMYWMRQWWVADAHQNSIIATYTYATALQLTQQRILIKFYAEGAEKFYAKQPFTAWYERQRHTLFIGPEASIILGRFPRMRYAKSLVNGSSRLISTVLKRSNWKKAEKRTQNIRVESLSHIDEEAWNFIEPLVADDSIVKDRAYLNWQLSPSQYETTTPEYKSLVVAYGNPIQAHTFVIRHEDQIIGFVSYLLIHKECNLKYLLCQPEHLDLIIDALLREVCRSRALFIFTDDQTVASRITERYRIFYHYQVTKKALAHNSIYDLVREFQVSEGDGHFY